MVIQGRNITAEEIGLIRDLMTEHREWGRTRLSQELCRHWDWRNAQGRIKDMAARTLLLKLERRGFIELPAPQRPSSNAFRNRCALFGSAAWTCADRDAFLQWDKAARQRNLQGLTNNTRFLVLPWVRVPHLASHVLGLIARRICADWHTKYGHPVHALETFVDRSRFLGTCYRAANWQRLGATQGRTRNDRNRRIQATVKDVYLYGLTPDFRRELCA